MCANKQREREREEVGIPKGPTCSTGSTARALQVQLRPGDKREGKKGERERERGAQQSEKMALALLSSSTSAPLCHFDPTPLLCCVVVCHCTDRPGPPPPFIHSLTASLPNTFRLCETGPAYPECESGVHSTSFLQSQQRAIFSPPNIAEWTPTSCQKISMVTPPLELQDFPSLSSQES